MPTAITMTTIDARFMVEVPLITRGDPATFFGAVHHGEGSRRRHLVAASKRVYCFGSVSAVAVSTLIVAASALAIPFTWTYCPWWSGSLSGFSTVQILLSSSLT